MKLARTIGLFTETAYSPLKLNKFWYLQFNLTIYISFAVTLIIKLLFLPNDLVHIYQSASTSHGNNEY